MAEVEYPPKYVLERKLQHSVSRLGVRLCREVLVMVMRKHQRYFPVYDAEDNLLPLFVTVANGIIHSQTVVTGHFRLRLLTLVYVFNQAAAMQVWVVLSNNNPPSYIFHLVRICCAKEGGGGCNHPH